MSLHHVRTLSPAKELEVVKAYTETDEPVASIRERFGLKGNSVVSQIVRRHKGKLRQKRRSWLD